MFIADSIKSINPDSAIVLFNMSKIWSERLNDSSSYVRSLTFIALTHQIKGDYEKAIKLSYTALDTAKLYNNKKEEGTILNNIGAIYFETNDYSSSEKYYNEALKIMQELKDTVWISKIYGNFAGVYFMKQDYETCINYLDKSLQFALQTNRLESVGGAISNKAMVYSAIGKKDKAIESYTEGAEILKKAGDLRGLCMTLNQLANFYFENNNIIKAEKTYNRVINLSENKRFYISIIGAYKGLAKLKKSQNKFEDALTYYTKYASWNDSLINKQKVESINNLNIKYQTEKKAQQNKILLAENKLKTSKIEQSKTERVFYILGIILIIIIAILILFQLISKRKTNKILVDKNNIINKSLKERETLVKEVHHRVKNNLQVISSMLNIQANSITDDNTKKQLLESRSKVQAMSLVHQKLYLTNNISEVNVKEYLSSLISDLEFSFENDETEIEITINIDEIKLHIDKAISIGLIVNELVTNIFKYAFVGKSEGKINVYLTNNDGSYTLIISDNGKGFKTEEINQNSFGTRLIVSLAKSINAEINYKINKGTQVTIKF